MSSYDLYAGEVQLDFDEKKHVYTVDGENVLSVTGITGIIDKSGPLMWWSVGQCLEYVESRLPTLSSLDEVQTKAFLHDAHRAHLKSSRAAADVGTVAHDWIDDFLKGKRERTDLPKNQLARTSVESFLEWFDENVDEVIETEFKCYSREHNYAGTADFDGIVNGERVIADWKTGKAIYPEYELQGNGYVIAREEELDITYDAIWIVALPKDGGKIKAKRFVPAARAQNGFLGALALYRALKEK